MNGNEMEVNLFRKKECERVKECARERRQSKGKGEKACCKGGKKKEGIHFARPFHSFSGYIRFKGLVSTLMRRRKIWEEGGWSVLWRAFSVNLLSHFRYLLFSFLLPFLHLLVKLSGVCNRHRRVAAKCFHSSMFENINEKINQFVCWYFVARVSQEKFALQHVQRS